MTEEQVRERTLSVAVWSFDALKENEFLGLALIALNDLDLTSETTGWYPLTMSLLAGGNPSPRTDAPT